VPVIPTVAVRRRGLTELAEAIAEGAARRQCLVHPRAHLDMAERRMEAHAIAGAAIISESAKHRLHSRLDQVLLHPWLGPVILFALLFVVFQAVFSWAKPFQDGLQGVVDLIVGFVKAEMPAGCCATLSLMAPSRAWARWWCSCRRSSSCSSSSALRLRAIWRAPPS
jgi:ferrous iron transport protein B